MNFNSNAQESYSNRGHPNPLLEAQRQQQQQREASMRSLAIGEMMERARQAAAAATNANRSQSPSIQTQMIDALQRSEQLHIAETNAAKQQSSANVGLSESPSSPLETNVSPTSRANRAKKSYPRPPLLNTWQGRGADYDEFAGLMTDREKQWVVKIQLHQVSQSEEEVRNQLDQTPSLMLNRAFRIIIFISGRNRNDTCNRFTAINRRDRINERSTSVIRFCNY